MNYEIRQLESKLHQLEYELWAMRSKLDRIESDNNQLNNQVGRLEGRISNYYTAIDRFIQYFIDEELIPGDKNILFEIRQYLYP